MFVNLEKVVSILFEDEFVFLYFSPEEDREGYKLEGDDAKRLLERLLGLSNEHEAGPLVESKHPIEH